MLVNFEDNRYEDNPMPPHNRRGLTFDPTINAGHLLTFFGMAIALFIGWSSLDKRVIVLEEAKIYQRERDTQQDLAINTSLLRIESSLKDLQKNVEELRKEASGNSNGKGK